MSKTRVFDLYGTLIDLNSVIEAYGPVLCPGTVERLSDVWRAKQLEFAWVASLTGTYETFSELTQRALKVALESLQVEADQPLYSGLLETYSEARVFPEVKATLDKLKAQGDRLVVLSNGDAPMLADALEASGMSESFDLIVSVDPVRQFKPSPTTYGHAEDQLGSSGKSIWFYSSNPWDVYGATCFGWRTTWVNRSGKQFEYPSSPSEGSVTSLTAL